MEEMEVRRLGFLKRDERGLTLVEVLVSVALLVLMSMTFAPALMFVLESAERNRIRTTATVLANEVIEELRTKTFDEIIIDGDNPVGEREEERTVDGHEYRIRTMISWLELDESGAASWDYKGIKVEVAPLGSHAGKGSAVTLETAVSRDFSLPLLKGANIRVHALWGWQEAAYENLKINLMQDGRTVSSVRTDDKGTARLFELEEGAYTVVPEVPPGQMLKPGTCFAVDAVNGVTESIGFYLEKPCRLAVTVNFLDGEGNPLQRSGKIILRMPFVDGDSPEGELLCVEKSVSGGSTVVFEGLWPVKGDATGYYSIAVIAGELYYDTLTDEAPPWNGAFQSPGQSRTLTLNVIEDEDEDEHGGEG